MSNGSFEMGISKRAMDQSNQPSLRFQILNISENDENRPVVGGGLQCRRLCCEYFRLEFK